jgi:hypothetical protein
MSLFIVQSQGLTHTLSYKVDRVKPFVQLPVALTVESAELNAPWSNARLTIIMRRSCGLCPCPSVQKILTGKSGGA